MRYLPGGRTAVTSTPAQRLDLSQCRWLHSVLTRLVGKPHDPRLPAWALRPGAAPSGGSCGWEVYWFRDDLAARLQDTSHSARLGRAEVDLHFGALQRLPAPPLQEPAIEGQLGRRASDACRLLLETRTPVVQRAHGGRVRHAGPRSTALTTYLAERAAPALLGTRFPRQAVPVHVVADASRSVEIPCGRKLGQQPAWIGQLILETNALGRWLLQAAAAGPGLGGRTAYGFGTIAVSDLGGGYP